MRAEDVVARARSRHRLLVQHGDVFFNTSDEQEMLWWRNAGADTRAWYTPQELAGHARRGITTLRQAWEVRVFNVCDPVWELDLEGDETDVTRERLVELARQVALDAR